MLRNVTVSLVHAQILLEELRSEKKTQNCNFGGCWCGRERRGGDWKTVHNEEIHETHSSPITGLLGTALVRNVGKHFRNVSPSRRRRSTAPRSSPVPKLHTRQHVALTSANGSCFTDEQI
jgi:hypothetical protein